MADQRPSPLEDRSLANFVARLGSGAPTPGSGAAAAVSLALAAGCLRKAASITLKRQDDAVVKVLGEEAGALVAAALAGAEEEAASFRGLLRAATRQAVDEVLEVGEALSMCAAAVLDLASRLEGRIDFVVQGDLRAARTLALAAQQIVAANAAEAARARTAP